MTSPHIQIVDIGGTPHISASDAVATSGFSREYITRRARAGTLPAHRIGRNWFIALSSLRSLAVTGRADS